MMNAVGSQSIFPQGSANDLFAASSLYSTNTGWQNGVSIPINEQLISETYRQIQNEQQNGESDFGLLPWQTGMNRIGLNSWGGMNEWDTELMERQMERWEEEKRKEEIERMREEAERMSEEIKKEKERKGEEENKKLGDLVAWLMIASSLKLFNFAGYAPDWKQKTANFSDTVQGCDASALYLDEWLDFTLEQLDVADAPRLFILLAGARPIVEYTFKSSPNRIQLRQETCGLSLDVGTGSQSLARFYYDSAGDECRQFVYTGEGGNANNFEKLDQCNVLCRPDSTEAKEKIDEATLSLQVFEVIDFILSSSYGFTYPARIIVQLLLTRQAIDI